MKFAFLILTLTLIMSCGKHANSKKKSPRNGFSGLTQAQIDKACSGNPPNSLEGRWTTNLLDDFVDFAVFLEFRDNREMFAGIECMVQTGRDEYSFFSSSEYVDYKISGFEIDLFMQGDIVATDERGKEVCALKDISGNYRWGFKGKCLYMQLSDEQAEYFIKQKY